MCIYIHCTCTSTSCIAVYTGKTPQRRDFSYPQHLAQTRPHSDVLRAFQPSISLPPLPESDSEEEEEVSSPLGCRLALSHFVLQKSEVLPSFDLSQDTSEVESLETTTTSVITTVVLWS